MSLHEALGYDLASLKTVESYDHWNLEPNTKPDCAKVTCDPQEQDYYRKKYANHAWRHALRPVIGNASMHYVSTTWTQGYNQWESLLGYKKLAFSTTAERTVVHQPSGTTEAFADTNVKIKWMEVCTCDLLSLSFFVSFCSPRKLLFFANYNCDLLSRVFEAVSTMRYILGKGGLGLIYSLLFR